MDINKEEILSLPNIEVNKIIAKSRGWVVQHDEHNARYWIMNSDGLPVYGDFETEDELWYCLTTTDNIVDDRNAIELLNEIIEQDADKSWEIQMSHETMDGTFPMRWHCWIMKFTMNVDDYRNYYGNGESIGEAIVNAYLMKHYDIQAYYEEDIHV